MLTITELLATKKGSTADVMSLFDSLPPVNIEFMIGRWKGSELSTDHRMDGLLEYSGWYGKMFINADEVHPLLFYTHKQKALYAVNPKLIPLQMNFPKSKALGTVMKIAKPFLKSKKSKARLRMMEYRGKITATMAYDQKPIFDHFAKIDDNTMLGCMELKGDSQPYFWIMERDDHNSYVLQF